MVVVVFFVRWIMVRRSGVCVVVAELGVNAVSNFGFLMFVPLRFQFGIFVLVLHLLFFCKNTHAWFFANCLLFWVHHYLLL
jgi:hypothetical protein